MKFLRQLLSQLQLFIIGATMAVIVVIFWLLSMQFFPEKSAIDSVPTVISSPGSNPIKTDSNKPITIQKFPNSQPFFGHFPYFETNLTKLTLISSYGLGDYQRFEKLHQAAAKELMKLIYTARSEGIWSIVISGFRTIKQQQKLWNTQVKKFGSQ